MNHSIETANKVMEVLNLIADGDTPTRACSKAGIRWSTLKAYLEHNPELQELYNDAEQRGIDTLADILLDLEANEKYGTQDPQKQKVRSDNIKWYISRKRPKQYGDRVVVENTFTMDRVVLDALERGKQRALSNAIEARITEVVEDAVEDAVELYSIDEYDISKYL